MLVQIMLASSQLWQFQLPSTTVSTIRVLWRAYGCSRYYYLLFVAHQRSTRRLWTRVTQLPRCVPFHSRPEAFAMAAHILHGVFRALGMDGRVSVPRVRAALADAGWKDWPVAPLLLAQRPGGGCPHCGQPMTLSACKGVDLSAAKMSIYSVQLLFASKMTINLLTN